MGNMGFFWAKIWEDYGSFRRFWLKEEICDFNEDIFLLINFVFNSIPMMQVNKVQVYRKTRATY